MAFVVFGYFLVFFRFSLNGFDVLPDFLGYTLILVGLMKLDKKSNQFVKAKCWAIGMALISFLLSVSPLFDIHVTGAIAIIINFLVFLISTYLAYLIVLGFQDIEINYNVEIGASKLKLVWIIWAALTAVCKVLIFIPHATVTLVLSGLTLTAIATNVIYLVFLYKAGRMSALI